MIYIIIKDLHYEDTHPIILSILLFCFAAGAFFVGHMALSYATFQATENFCVLLDAGHGGADPGKVSASGIKEKDINLAITLNVNLSWNRMVLRLF